MSDYIPAFPQAATSDGYATNTHPGMSLRDYFAAAALPAWVQVLGARYGMEAYSDSGAAHEAARLALITAEDMLKAREQ